MLRGFSRIPAHVLNGLTVAAGIGIAQLLVARLMGGGAVQAATAGALYASLPHLVARSGLVARRALAGGLIGSATALTIGLLSFSPLALNLGIAGVAFVAMMTVAWGPRAGPLSFTAILAVVFALAAPRSEAPWLEAAWTLFGAGVYALWAFVGTRLLEQRYRTLAVAAAIGASARLLRSRAAVLEERAQAEQDKTARWRQIDEEALLAALLQSARDLVFAGTLRPHRIAHQQLLVRTIELRDLLLTSRLDLDLLGEDEVAYEIRARLARSLRASALTLDDVEAALESGRTPSLARGAALHEISRIIDERELPAEDPRLRLLPAIASRQRALVDLISELHEQLPQVRAESSLSPTELGQLTADESWPLSQLWRHLSLGSPVFRHAVRSAVALVAAHALGSVLPWATHSHWLVLSVAVVLRGTFAQTLSRRNQRVLGTAAGCLLALALATLAPEFALAPILWLAAGTAHAFVNVRYTLTAAAATVMALLQTRATAHFTPEVLIERLADTVLGAGLAWAFSYVLPSWSRRTLPQAVESALETLCAYAESAISDESDAQLRQRMLREQAYAALDVLISTVRLSSVEPTRVRPPIEVLASFIDHAQSLMAHLSSLRLLLLRRSEQLAGTATRAALTQARSRVKKRLEADAEPNSISPRAPLNLELPSVPAERAAFPWLQRRLSVVIYEAHRAGEAGRSALGLLRERSTSEFPAATAQR